MSFAFHTMNLLSTPSTWLRAGCFFFALLGSAVFGQSQPAAADADTIVGKEPMRLETPGTGVSGQLQVATEVVSGTASGDLVYTITEEPKSGRVGLAGGEQEDFYQNKSGRLGYFAYQPRAEFVGEDSFGYTVRNETTGLVFKNKVVSDSVLKLSNSPPSPICR